MCNHKMNLFVVGCVFIVYFMNSLLAQKGCSFSAHHQNEKHAPIILYNDTTLVMSTKGVIHLRNQELVRLLCPDPKNYLEQSHSNTNFARCIRGKILRIANGDYNFDELQCHHIIKGIVSTSTKKCGDDEGFIYKIGYVLSSKTFIKLVEVCYDQKIGSVLYTQHLLHGQDIKYASKSNYRPSFSPEAATVAVSVAYTQVYQKAALNRLLGSALLAGKYINKASFLSRGHLSPDADFLYAATQYSTYYYVNTCPQWQAINAANWRRVETMVRDIAHKRQETLTVITGSYDVLTLPDVDGEEVEIFLVSGKKLPVPKFIWKTVFSKKSKQAVVLISLNNPFVKNIKGQDILCRNICNKVGWDSPSWGDYERGFVYCCDYREFATVVKTAPKLDVVEVLQGPK